MPLRSRRTSSTSCSRVIRSRSSSMSCPVVAGILPTRLVASPRRYRLRIGNGRAKSSARSVSQCTSILAWIGRADERAGRGIDQDGLRSAEGEAMGGLDLVTALLERVEGRAQSAVLEQDLSAFRV